MRKVIVGMVLAVALAIGSSAAFANEENSLIFYKQSQTTNCQLWDGVFASGNPNWGDVRPYNPSDVNMIWRDGNCGAPQVVVAGRNKQLPIGSPS